MSKLISVLLVDDHASMRDSLAQEFCAENGFIVVGSIPAAMLAENECKEKHPDIVIMDVCTIGDFSGIKAAEAIRKKFPGIKIIVTSGFDEITYIPRAKQAGAHAFVSKSKRLEYYREVAWRVLGGEYIFPAPATIPLPQGESPFTEREMDVLKLLCRQRSNQKIAEELMISVNTVRRHIENMRQKAGFDTASELVIHVISNGWINPKY